MERTKTGIPGLDELLHGGLVEGSAILLSGGAGTGKTIFGTQFIYRGAADYNEPGIYITLEEGTNNIWWNMKSFHWDITKMQKQDMVKIYRIGMFNPQEIAEQFEKEVSKIKDMVQEINAKRLVIDSTTAFGMFMKNDAQIRHNLFKLISEMKDLDCTTLLISETLGKRDQYSRFGVEEFVVDGVVMLYFKPPIRALLLKKMRGTDHDKRVHPFEISDNGIDVNASEQVLWESLKE